MSIRVGLYILVLLCAQLKTATAEVSNGQRHEVAHLLNFVADTSCIIDRNGSRHNGQDALDHINKKYAYFRDDITSTEAFIERAASKSMFSGSPYTVRCNDEKVITTQQWLLDELFTYRKGKTKINQRRVSE